ncbi:helix-turn-helix domain-containing protein [Blautia sp. 2227st1_G12_2227SCRN_220401]|uniref:helix-turn-helix domain-containing protein n=1 Tax=Blautia TaxID=572511 RepID=UPI00319D8E62
MFSAQLSSQITVLLFGYQLSPDEKNLLRTYFSLEMSLADAAEKLFLHKNTFQYKLNHIYKKCGLNPRKFRDAVLLYLALELE